ncbi:MAG: hypothetical protein CM15mP98_07100 [Paracoccaceae bacterium]|nr:MAG: hypothetical protein CM15mP98_07100 [Paracoccaceae bacterium]
MPSKTTGGWAHVKFGVCKENKNFTCGTLIKAFSRDGKAVKNYEHKGKYVVWDMKKEGDKNFSGGKIKDYSDGKVYNSKMEILTKNKIGVSGCVLFYLSSTGMEQGKIVSLNFRIPFNKVAYNLKSRDLTFFRMKL